MKSKLHIVKIGGNVIDDPNALDLFLKDFASVKEPKILIHGGGKLATELAGKLGISQVMWHGRRITDAATLKVTVMAYAGWINKTIVAKLNTLGDRALGLCGADLNLIGAVKRDHPEIDFGYVGDISCSSVNSGELIELMKNKVLVIAPITSDINGQLLNTNADTIASTLAAALAIEFDVQLNYCFEKKGVLREVENEESWVPRMNQTLYREMKSADLISKGMIPKLDNSFNALKSGVKGVYIGHFTNLLKMITCDDDAGTCIA